MVLSGDAQQTREYAPPEALLGRCAVGQCIMGFRVRD